MDNIIILPYAPLEHIVLNYLSEHINLSLDMTCVLAFESAFCTISKCMSVERYLYTYWVFNDEEIMSSIDKIHLAIDMLKVHYSYFYSSMIDKNIDAIEVIDITSNSIIVRVAT